MVDASIHLKALRNGFSSGYHSILSADDLRNKTEMDFGIRLLGAEEESVETTLKETCWLLLRGKIEITLGGQRSIIERGSIFDEKPSAVHVGTGKMVRLCAKDGDAEICVVRATNEAEFESRIYLPGEVRSERRGEGQVQGTATRIVRTIFDFTNQKKSKLVIGEVINLPGRWSSYPPHHHDQPEIYHYRFTEPSGYGHAEIGDEVVKVKQYDTIQIPARMDHAQVSAPGYGMYYVWAIRHLPGNPYTQPEFTAEHAWTMDAKKQGWTPKGSK